MKEIEDILSADVVWNWSGIRRVLCVPARTAQRWGAIKGLPYYRGPGQAIWAIPSQLRLWMWMTAQLRVGRSVEDIKQELEAVTEGRLSVSRKK